MTAQQEQSTIKEGLNSRLDSAHRAVPALFGLLALAFVAILFLWYSAPRLFPAYAHGLLGATSLALIAVAYLAYQSVRRPGRAELLKAVLLAIAFFLWAANQLWPDGRRGALLNDIAIGLFVLDVFLVIIGWPANSPDESFAESYAELEPGDSDD